MVSRIGAEDEENSIIFQLLSTLVEAGNESVAPHIPYMVSLLVGKVAEHIPADPESWPQVCGIPDGCLGVLTPSWIHMFPTLLFFTFK